MYRNHYRIPRLTNQSTQRKITNNKGIESIPYTIIPSVEDFFSGIFQMSSGTRTSLSTRVGRQRTRINVIKCPKTKKPYEANLLLLDSSKAKTKLNWKPRWSLDIALDKIIEWHQAWKEKKAMAEISIVQINSYDNFQGKKIVR